MGWVHREPQKHKCCPPVRAELEREGANKGDVWRCDDCDSLWIVVMNYQCGYLYMQQMTDAQTEMFIFRPGGRK